MPVRAFEERRPSLQLALVKPKTTVTHYARIKRDAKKTHPDVRKFLAPVAQMSRTFKAHLDQMPLSMVRRAANGERKIGISGSVARALLQLDSRCGWSRRSLL